MGAGGGAGTMPRRAHSFIEKARRSATMGKTVTQERARQGHWGRRTLIILLVGLALAGVVWLGVEIYGQMIEPPAEDLPGNVTG